MNNDIVEEYLNPNDKKYEDELQNENYINKID